MESPRVLLQFPKLLLLLPTLCLSSPAYHWRITSYGAVEKTVTTKEDQSLPTEFSIYYYEQTLDHFNYKCESYLTFPQKYTVNSKYWGGANTGSPIFVYPGNEANSIDGIAMSAGFMIQLASRFKGLLLYIEHRYYGDSMPFGYKQIEGQNASTLGFLSSSQALADYAQLILDLKRNLSAENCPVIAIGGSYGGMLASWLRLKYPHITIGALAASAPILYFDDLTPQNGYHVIVTKDFRDTSENCYNTIRQSWFEIDHLVNQPNGLMNLSNIFSSCKPLQFPGQLKGFLGFVYVFSAQHDYSSVGEICKAIDGAPEGTDILGKVAKGLNASFFSGDSCNDIFDIKPNNSSGWYWQTCTEMVMPIGHGEDDTMFQASPFNLEHYIRNCLDIFGVSPRPHWITTEFGGHDMKSVLGNFASNIIFSNGQRDPWSAGGVLQNISDTIVAIYTKEGTHCMDLSTPTTNDPNWLVEQRDKEINIIGGWIQDYNAKRLTSNGCLHRRSWLLFALFGIGHYLFIVLL